MTSMPEKVGKYKIVRLLGKGPMGDVFLGEISTPSGKEYMAIKMLNSKRVILRTDAPKFIQEISHENIMRYLSIDPIAAGSEQLYIVMDYLEVRPISRKTLKTTLSGQLLEIFAQVADACHHAHGKEDHGRKILHLNIKPSNLLIRRPGGVKIQPMLTDWGLAYIYAPEVFVGLTFDSTVSYMSPEVAEAFVKQNVNASFTPAADVYSLTLVLLETLIRRALYLGAKGLDDLHKMKREQKFMLLNVNFPKKNIEIKPLNDLILKNLSFEPDKRMQSMKELSEGLKACIAKEPAAK